MESDPISSSINSFSLLTSSSTVSLSATLPSPDRLVVLTFFISTKLTRGNFLAWKCQIEPTLHGHGLYQYLVDDLSFKHITTSSDIQSNNMAYYHCTNKINSFFTWIHSSLSKTILNHTVSCTISSHLWKLLQQSFPYLLRLY